jgi:iron complex transport system ATP-binding protein
VELSLPVGRFVCVIGPNGAGKTTLLRTLAGLLPPRAGRVLFDGAPIDTLSAGERAKRMSVVLTSTPAPGFMSVGGLVELGRIPHTGLMGRLSRADHEAVRAAMDTVGVEDLADRRVAQISDGERQRAAVARALAQAAEVVMLDEPTAFLDVAGRATVMTSLQRIAHRTARLVVATSHDVELVLRTADIVVVIGSDGTVQAGCPEDLALSGCFETLYPSNTLRFDLDSGRFLLARQDGPAVVLSGDGPRAFWTAHALERIGYTVLVGSATGSESRASADGATENPEIARVQVESDQWVVKQSEESRRVGSIQALADQLR